MMILPQIILLIGSLLRREQQQDQDQDESRLTRRPGCRLLFGELPL